MKKHIKNTIAITIVIVLFLSGIVLAASTVRASSDLNYYATITIDNTKVAADHVNFPVLIQDTFNGTDGEPDLRTVANGGDIENTTAGGNNDFITIPADFNICGDPWCNQEFDFEFERYVATTGYIVLFVEIPEMDSATDLDFYMLYGDSGTTVSPEDVNGTWDEHFSAVWHMSEASGNIKDSTVNNNDSNSYAGSWTAWHQSGSPGYSIKFASFSSPDSYFRVPDSDSFIFEDDYAIEFIVDYDDTSNGTQYVFSHGEDVADRVAWYMNNAGTHYSFQRNEGAYVDAYSNNATTASRVYLASTREDDLLEVYEAGVLQTDTGTQSGTINPSGYFWIGSINGSYGNDDMWISEIRISNTSARGADWIETTQNTFSPTTFLSVGVSGSPPIEPSPTPAATDTPTPTLTFTPTLTPTITPTPTPTPPAIVMGNSSISGVPAGLKSAIEVALNNYRPDEDMGLANPEMANMWAITSYTESTTSDYYWVSVAGMLVPDPGELDEWDLSYSIWTGLGIAEDNLDTTYTAHMDGAAGYTIMLDAAGLADIAHPDEGGLGSGGIYFPWAAGYTAYYGAKGVHGAGPNDPAWGGVGWRAVDWVGGAVGYSGDIFPNGAYVSQSGKVSYVCQDDVQTWVQIGDFLYGHLVDNSTLRMDIYHSQGSYLGALVTGTHLTAASSGSCLCPSGGTDCVDSKCGYMCQRETSYHLHWGFIPSGSYFITEEWTLNTTSEYWRRGIEDIGPGQYMLAEWSSRPIVPTPGPTVTPGGPTVTPGVPIIINDGGGAGGQIWDGFINGMKNAVQNRVTDLNTITGTTEHQPRKYIQLAVSGIRIMIRSVYILLRSTLDMRVTIVVVFMILIMEPVRMMGAVWMWIKSKVPFIG